MLTFLLLKQLFRRALSQKNAILISLAITIVTIFFAVFFTSKFEIKGNIALITHGQEEYIHASNQLRITELEQAPPLSALVMHKYDAVVTDKGDGTFAIQTLKNKTFEQELAASLQNPKANTFREEETRGVGSNIVGFLVMFVLLQAVMFMNFFPEDKENGTLKRILVSPVSIDSYLAAQCIYNFLIVMVPTWLVIVVCKQFGHVKVGFDLFQYIVILSILSFLATAFSLFVYALLENQDNARALSSSIILITSILSGTFYSFTTQDAIMRNLLQVLPQKHFLLLVQGMENGQSMLDLVSHLVYVLGFAGIMLLIGSIVCKRRWKEGRYA